MNNFDGAKTWPINCIFTEKFFTSKYHTISIWTSSKKKNEISFKWIFWKLYLSLLIFKLFKNNF